MKEREGWGERGSRGLHRYGQTNWDDLLIECIFGSCTAPSHTLLPWPCEAATGWLQLTECWWETAVRRPPPPSQTLPPSQSLPLIPTNQPPLTTPPLKAPPPLCHDRRHYLWDRKTRLRLQQTGRKWLSQTLRTVCVSVDVCLIHRLIWSYGTDSNPPTHLFLQSCEVQVSLQDLKSLDLFPVVLSKIYY